MVEARADVIVVGARAAGAATALLLARAGRSVIMLDRGRPGADTLSTHALMRGGVVQLRRWGLLAQVIGAGTPPIRGTSFHYSSGRVDVDLKPTAGGRSAVRAPSHRARPHSGGGGASRRG